jgi:hypothetical protein
VIFHRNDHTTQSDIYEQHFLNVQNENILVAWQTVLVTRVGLLGLGILVLFANLLELGDHTGGVVRSTHGLGVAGQDRRAAALQPLAIFVDSGVDLLVVVERVVDGIGLGGVVASRCATNATSSADDSRATKLDRSAHHKQAHEAAQDTAAAKQEETNH